MKSVIFIFPLVVELLLSSALKIQDPDPIPRFHASLASNIPPKDPLPRFHPSLPGNIHQNTPAKSSPAQNLYPVVFSTSSRFQPVFSPQDAEAPVKTKVTLGYLPAVSGYMYNKQGRSISGALSYAVDLINKNPSILPDVELDFIYNDTLGLPDLTQSLLLDDLVHHNVAAFIGPEGPNCGAAASLAASANRPMLSFHCTDLAATHATKYPTFVRLDPSSTQLAAKAIEIVRRQGRTDFVIAAQKSADWDVIGREVERLAADDDDMSVAGYEQLDDYDVCCMDDLPCCEATWPIEVLRRTQLAASTIVFIGKPKYLVQFNKALSEEGVFEAKELAVIYLSPDVIKKEDLQYLLWSKDQLHRVEACEQIDNYQRLLPAWKSLTVVAQAESFQFPPKFAENVRKYNSLPPFSFPNLSFILPGWKSSLPEDVSMYGAHLFDSVVVYAVALHNLILRASSAEEDIEDISVDNLSKDGRRMRRAILESGPYQSVSGHFVKFNTDGESAGKFTSFTLKSQLFSRSSAAFGNTFTCGHYLVEEPNHLQNEQSRFGKRVTELVPGGHFKKKLIELPLGEFEKKLTSLPSVSEDANWDKYYLYRINEMK